MNNTIYIGDAVYAHFDGNGNELRLNDHRNPCLIYLEPEVMENLIEFWQASRAAAAPSVSDDAQKRGIAEAATATKRAWRQPRKLFRASGHLRRLSPRRHVEPVPFLVPLLDELRYRFLEQADTIF